MSQEKRLRLHNEARRLEAIIAANKAEASGYFDSMYLLDNYITSHWLAYRTYVAALREINKELK